MLPTKANSSPFCFNERDVLEVLEVFRAPNIGGNRKLFCKKAMISPPCTEDRGNRLKSNFNRAFQLDQRGTGSRTHQDSYSPSPIACEPRFGHTSPFKLIPVILHGVVSPGKTAQDQALANLVTLPWHSFHVPTGLPRSYETAPR
jgi:hypothetical protein